MDWLRNSQSGRSTVAVEVRRAEEGEVHVVSSILIEAVCWLEAKGMPMWSLDEVAPEAVAPAVCQGMFVLAFVDNRAAGTLRFQLSDPEFWPEGKGEDSAFIHRLAVRRRYAGKAVSTALIGWAAEEARRLGRIYLRLDCDARRPRLRSFYEAHGFRSHSEIRWGSFDVARYELPVEVTPERADRGP